MLHAQVLGSGPPLVLVHGISGNMMTWYWIAGRLSQRHRVILFDLRGHGLSATAPTGYDVQTLADDLEAVVTTFTDEPIALAGHSYGAMIALSFALRDHVRVRKLALVEAPYPVAARQAELRKLDGKTVDAIAQALLPKPLHEAVIAGNRRGRKFLERGRALLESTTCFEDCRREQDLADAVIQRVQVPFLVVNGSASSCLDGGRRLGSLVHHGRHVMLPGGHNLPSEAGHGLAAELGSFFHA
jgi:pimeloyl-ACP methyl ester carboxylesterase